MKNHNGAEYRSGHELNLLADVLAHKLVDARLYPPTLTITDQQRDVIIGVLRMTADERVEHRTGD